MRSFRNKARQAADWPFCSSAAEVKRLGNADSGWVIHTGVPFNVCYCAGVGQSIIFEEGLAKLAQRPVLVFDPSPTAIPTIARTDMRNLEFFPIGFGAENGVIQFSVPE